MNLIHLALPYLDLWLIMVVDLLVDKDAGWI